MKHKTVMVNRKLRRLVELIECTFRIDNINLFVLQELGILLGGCLTVKNYWGLLTGDKGAWF